MQEQHVPSVADKSVPAPTFAEQVRTLLHAARTGLLSSLSVKVPGFPFGSLAPYGLGENGRPTFLFSALAVHARNLESDDRASLFVSESDAGDAAPLSLRRATLLGSVSPVPVADLGTVRGDYLERHPDARQWADFADFRFFQLQPAAIYFVGGFGSMRWVDPAEYSVAAPDPLADSAAMIIAHMNADHTDALLLYCNVYARLPAEAATLTEVDRRGFCVRARTGTDWKTVRIAFPDAVSSAEEARRAFVTMVRSARAQTTPS
jgi:putative heme iron utilization protein